MDRLEVALEDCLERMAEGESMQACLSRYPEHSQELAPLLKAAEQVQAGGHIQPSMQFKTLARSRLVNHMRSHPRERKFLPVRGWKPVWQGAVSLVVFLFAFLVAGTAYAQSAGPGGPMYGWKLASENVWLAISPDPVATDLALANRRAQEVQASMGAEREIALQGYQQVLTRLADQSASSDQQRIVPVLTEQRHQLMDSGITVPGLDEYLSNPGGMPSEQKPTPTSATSDGNTTEPAPTDSMMHPTSTPEAPMQTLQPGLTPTLPTETLTPTEQHPGMMGTPQG